MWHHEGPTHIIGCIKNVSMTSGFYAECIPQDDMRSNRGLALWVCFISVLLIQ